MVSNLKSAIQLLHQIEERMKELEVLLPFSKPIMNIDEISRYTGLSKSTIYKLTCSGRIPHYKQSRHLFFDREEIETWLKSNSIQTQKERENQAIRHTKLKGGIQ